MREREAKRELVLLPAERLKVSSPVLSRSFLVYNVLELSNLNLVQSSPV